MVSPVDIVIHNLAFKKLTRPRESIGFGDFEPQFIL